MEVFCKIINGYHPFTIFAKSFMIDVFAKSFIIDVWQGPKYDALRDLELFAQFKKRGKHPWRIVNFSKVAG